MIDLSQAKQPVLLEPEHALELVRLLQDIKAAAALIGREETGNEIFDMARQALQLADKFAQSTAPAALEPGYFLEGE